MKAKKFMLFIWDVPTADPEVGMEALTQELVGFFDGTEEEVQRFVSEQRGASFGYELATPEEMAELDAYEQFMAGAEPFFEPTDRRDIRVVIAEELQMSIDAAADAGPCGYVE